MLVSHSTNPLYNNNNSVRGKTLWSEVLRDRFIVYVKAIFCIAADLNQVANTENSEIHKANAHICENNSDLNEQMKQIC